MSVVGAAVVVPALCFGAEVGGGDESRAGLGFVFFVAAFFVVSVSVVVVVRVDVDVVFMLL